MIRWLTISAAMILVLGTAAVPGGSSIKGDERVVFFPMYATYDPAEQVWTIRIHGWIFEPEEDSIRRKAAVETLRRSLELENEGTNTQAFRRRARLFVVDNERGKDRTIAVGGRVYAVGRSAANGHFAGRFTLTEAEMGVLRGRGAVRDGRLQFAAVMDEDDQRTFAGAVELLKPEGVSVISDIDDTIKISHVTDKTALLRATFIEPFAAAPGMADFYRELAAAGASFHYVSSSPWQLYEPLDEWMGEAGYPRGSLHLKAFRWKDSSIFELFKSSRKTKPPVIEQIMADLPRRRFIFIGDSGEHDPEIYGDLARQHPDRVRHLFIRNVTGEARDNPRMRDAFRDLPAERWTLFEDAAGLAAPAVK